MEEEKYRHITSLCRIGGRRTSNISSSRNNIFDISSSPLQRIFIHIKAKKKCNNKMSRHSKGSNRNPHISRYKRDHAFNTSWQNNRNQKSIARQRRADHCYFWHMLSRLLRACENELKIPLSPSPSQGSNISHQKERGVSYSFHSFDLTYSTKSSIALGHASLTSYLL